jgi:hypothetical protein
VEGQAATGPCMPRWHARTIARHGLASWVNGCVACQSSAFCLRIPPKRHARPQASALDFLRQDGKVDVSSNYRAACSALCVPWGRLRLRTALL